MQKRKLNSKKVLHPKVSDIVWNYINENENNYFTEEEEKEINEKIEARKEKRRETAKKTRN